jgi:hypothetical protein
MRHRSLSVFLQNERVCATLIISVRSDARVVAVGSAASRENSHQSQHRRAQADRSFPTFFHGRHPLLFSSIIPARARIVKKEACNFTLKESYKNNRAEARLKREFKAV